jgi:CheY-like chemotaxis protein
MAVILVADDEDMIRGLLSHVLTTAGHQVLAAANGLEAVAIFRSYSSRIDLVITDMSMPVMDGNELVNIVRSDMPKTRIICMTGYAGFSCPQGTTLLHKPFRPSELLKMVQGLLILS